MSRRRGASLSNVSGGGKNVGVSINKQTTQLMALQARFQQKQLQEKEQKLLQLYDQQQQRAHQVAQRGSAGSNASDQSAVSANVVVNASANKVSLNIFFFFFPSYYGFLKLMKLIDNSILYGRL